MHDYIMKKLDKKLYLHMSLINIYIFFKNSKIKNKKCRVLYLKYIKKILTKL